MEHTEINQWPLECQNQNHHLIIGEEIRIFIKFFQAESRLICDICQKPGWWQVITERNRVWCFPCRRLLDTGRLMERITDEKNNSDEKIEEAIKKVHGLDDIALYK